MNVEDRSIDLVLTSPPYLNAIDYMRCSKFSLVWMGYSIAEIRTIRSDSIGNNSASEDVLNASWVGALLAQLGLHRHLSDRDLKHLSRYVSEMGRAIGEVSRVLRKGGRAVYIVGDSTIHGTFVRNSSIIAAIAQEKGLTLTSRQSRRLPADRRYLPPPQTGNVAPMDSRLRQEVVMAFAKP
jgi:DNA modification methylase